MPPDQKVTASPSALLPETSLRGQATNVTTRCASRKWISPCGSGPYASPATMRVAGESAKVTRCPGLTRIGNLFPPTAGTKSAVPPAPIIANGPTTRLLGRVNAPGKLASDRVEQSATAPVGAAPRDDVAAAKAGVAAMAAPTAVAAASAVRMTRRTSIPE